MGSAINSGDLRHQVTWQTLDQSTRDSVGQPVDLWVTQGVHFAKVEPMTGAEITNARQLQATSSIKITMRAVGPLKPSDRLLLDSSGRVFSIDSVLLTEEVAADLILTCTELKNPQ